MLGLFQAAVQLAKGVAASTASYQQQHDVDLRKRNAKVARKREACTPCAAAAYTNGLREWAQNQKK